MSNTNEDLTTYTVTKLNEKYGRDFIDPIKCKNIYEELINKKGRLGSEV